MCRVSTAPTATAGRSGLNWKKFSLSIRSVSQYPRASLDLPTDRTTSSPAKPPPRMRRRFFSMSKIIRCLAEEVKVPLSWRHGHAAAEPSAAEFPALADHRTRGLGAGRVLHHPLGPPPHADQPHARRDRPFSRSGDHALTGPGHGAAVVGDPQF